MLYLKRRRLIGWLIKAYIKKWGKTIFFSFVVGLFLFLLILTNIDYIVSKIPFSRVNTVGIGRVYTADNLPSEILGNLSRGLTTVAPDGTVTPDVAKNWKVTDGGRTYTFEIKKGILFTDGSPLTSRSLNYEFADASIERPNDYTIVFKLRESYSPFIVTMSRQIFKKGLIGVGDYKLKSIKLNGGFVQSMELSPLVAGKPTLKYNFYPSQEALKTAFVLGEINEIPQIDNITYNTKSLADFKSAEEKRYVNYQKLVTIFYNNSDSNLSDKRIRKALTYSIPDNLPWGERNYNSYAPTSWASTQVFNTYRYDLQRANDLLEETQIPKGKITLNVSTLKEYEGVARDISKYWSKIGIKSKITVVEGVPNAYQVFIGEIFLPKDPDQYILWHSGQPTNITRYKNLRIDKLLEDGRKTTDITERKKIYSDFQKYLLDDAPATFLYFPHSYSIKK